jgi:hypothetical protein
MKARKTTSVWRHRARPLVRAVLDAIPLPALVAVAANLRECRRALSAAMPHDWRAVSHGRKMWWAECNDQLDRRFPRAAAMPAPPRFALLASPKLWLTVDCGWCEGFDLDTRGCVVCGGMRQEVAEVVRRVEFVALARAARGDDEVALLALRDWLAEQGVEVEAPKGPGERRK